MSPRAAGATAHELSRVGLLATLSGETLGRLAERMRRETVSPGSAVVNEGEDGDRFYIVLSGMFTVSQGTTSGKSRSRWTFRVRRQYAPLLPPPWRVAIAPRSTNS